MYNYGGYSDFMLTVYVIYISTHVSERYNTCVPSKMHYTQLLLQCILSTTWNTQCNDLLQKNTNYTCLRYNSFPIKNIITCTALTQVIKCSARVR